MKNVISLTITLFFIFWSSAQEQLQNGDFETWENVGAATEEPENWSSLKTADALASTTPQVLTQDVGRNGGFCPRLEVKTVFGIAANGLMTNGRVHADFNPENGYVFTDENDPQWNTTFTSRPDSIVGWFKFAPQDNDKGKVEIILHVDEGRLPFNGFESNIVGRAKYEFSEEETEWKRFSAPFNYLSQVDPEFILVTVASGDSTIAKTGSVLWVDDFELIYNEDNTASIDESQLIRTVYAQDGYLIFNQLENIDYALYAVSGQLIQQGVSEKKTMVKINQPGIYLLEIQTEQGPERKRMYIH